MPRKSYKGTVFTIVALLIAAAIGYDTVVGPPASAQNLETTDVNAAETGVVSQQFTDLLNRIQALNLDTSILNDPAFASLTDYSVTLVPVESGRPNPFAPLSSAAQSTQTTNTPKGR